MTVIARGALQPSAVKETAVGETEPSVASVVETGTVTSTQYTENTTQFHIETFTGPGSFTVPSGVTDIDYLVVAGGGGGGKGSNRTGGGGSGGEVVTGSLAVSPGQVLPVIIGAGGWGGTSTSPAGDGLSSSFNSITAQGGGRGGQAATTPGVNAYGGGNNPGQNGAKGNINFMGGNGFDQGFSSGSFAGGGGGDYPVSPAQWEAVRRTLETAVTPPPQK